MKDRRTHIIAELEKNMEDSITFFRSFSPDELGTQVYQDGAKWTVFAGGPGSPEDFNVDRFNRSQPKKLDGLNIEELIAQFKSVREDTISIVNTMSDADFDREGRHAFHGHGKLERFIRWTYEHVNLHLDDIHQKRTL